MRALSTLTQLPTTKGQIKDYVEAVKNDILGGYINPLESAIILKSLEDVVKALRSDKDVKDYIWEEVNRHNEKTISFANAEIKKVNRRTYVFDGDAELEMLEDQEKEIKQLIKNRKELLKLDREPNVEEIMQINLAK